MLFGGIPDLLRWVAAHVRSLRYLHTYCDYDCDYGLYGCPARSTVNDGGRIARQGRRDSEGVASEDRCIAWKIRSSRYEPGSGQGKARRSDRGEGVSVPVPVLVSGHPSGLLARDGRDGETMRPSRFASEYWASLYD